VDESLVKNHNGYSAHSVTLRDLLTVGFRHRRLMMLAFMGVLSGAILAAVVQPNRYESAMKILVKRDRLDPVVTSQAAGLQQLSGQVSEEELNSEVELLRGRELLERVVLACDLYQKHGTGFTAFGRVSPAEDTDPTTRNQPDLDKTHRKAPGVANDLTTAPRLTSRKSDPDFFRDDVAPPRKPTAGEGAQLEGAVRTLEKKLTVGVVRKTNLIAVNYESPNPKMAARVLTQLANLYLERHVAVHRQSGAFVFFQRGMEQQREELNEAEARLVDFTRREGVVSAPVEKEAALQKLAEFKVSLKQTEASIAETQQRVRVLQSEAASIPTRMVTQVRNADDGVLLSQLRSTLLGLEQRRTMLLGKFQPGYKAVRVVETQIAQSRAALAAAENSKLRDETTDRDPTYEWVKAELAKAKADLAGLHARAQATALTVQSYGENAQRLEQKEVVQEGLVRSVKAAEQNYLLYLQKEEEARTSDALDRGRILNVAVAEAPNVPSVPANHRSRTVFAGVFLALLLSVGSAFTSEYLCTTFRTPSEIESVLNIPVLAAIPRDKSGGQTFLS
jgi:uncharacterized protein involved in exopolysaccharide biosynthesis